MTRYNFQKANLVHVDIQNSRKNAESSNYIKLGHPSSYVEYACFAGRGMPSLIAMLLMYMCNELGVCQGPISHNNEQTQSVEGII